LTPTSGCDFIDTRHRQEFTTAHAVILLFERRIVLCRQADFERLKTAAKSEGDKQRCRTIINFLHPSRIAHHLWGN
jgi:hypothetical protein